MPWRSAGPPKKAQPGDTMRLGQHLAAVFVITPTRGLLTPDTLVSADLLQEFATVDVSADDPRAIARRWNRPWALAGVLAAEAKVVLLGSVATGKYVDVSERARCSDHTSTIPPSSSGAAT